MSFSANLGFLWADRPLPDAIRAAKAAGFDAVECHWPYDLPAADSLMDAALIAERSGLDPTADRAEAARLYAACEAVPLLD